MKIGFAAFGCKVNSSENELFSSELASKGFEITLPIQADTIVVNTCAVTETAAKRCAAYVASLRRKKPEAKIIVTGCLASAGEADLKSIGADAVVSNGSKGVLIEHILSVSDGLSPVSAAPFYGGGPFKSISKTRAFFKIQDGCDAGCAYCIIPRLRGKPRSKPFFEAVTDFKRLVKSGFKEIVFVGIHIGMYGRGTERGLAELLEAATDVPGDFRIRLSSVEVGEVTDKLLSLMAGRGEKICPHLHIPLQSGSDAVLKNMGRRYSAADYVKTALKAKELVAGLTVGSDVITGFPGETEADFRRTVNTLKKAGTDFIHVFPYSDRRGTAASLMEGRLPFPKKEARASELRRIWKDVSLKSMEAMKGKTCRVLTERGGKGFCGNYMPVAFSSDFPPNVFINVLITGVKDGRLTCEILP